MKINDINEAMRLLSETRLNLESAYVENEGEVTEETEAMEAQVESIACMLWNDGIDSLGRWLASKEDQKKRLKAEKDSITRQIAAVDNTIDFIRSTVSRLMANVGQDKAKGTCYTFTQAVSTTTTVDKEGLKAAWAETVEKAIREAGLPVYVDVDLKASISKVPEGESVPEFFRTTSVPMAKFTKPRGKKEE